MRTLFIIIVIGALGYLAWAFRDELTGKIQESSDAMATPAPTAVVPENATPSPVQPEVPGATPAPKQFAPAGSFYVKHRVSIETPTGIKALNAGELVKMRFRNNDGTARVTTGKDDLVIKESLLTNDPDLVTK